MKGCLTNGATLSFQSRDCNESFPHFTFIPIFAAIFFEIWAFKQQLVQILKKNQIL
jgi:hypothetical protein